MRLVDASVTGLALGRQYPHLHVNIVEDPHNVLMAREHDYLVTERCEVPQHFGRMRRADRVEVDQNVIQDQWQRHTAS